MTSEEKAKDRQKRYYDSHREQMCARSQAYRRANPYKVRETLKQSRASREATIKVYSAAYRAAHLDECRAKAKSKRDGDRETRLKAEREYRLAHPDQMRETKRKYRSANRDKEQAARKRYNRLNKQKIAASHCAYAAANRGVVNAIVRRRHAMKLRAVPSWANTERMRQWYDEASARSSDTGIAHEVDHVIPLQSSLVCGLHCESNLQILTKAENRAKWNRFNVLFVTHETSGRVRQEAGDEQRIADSAAPTQAGPSTFDRDEARGLGLDAGLRPRSPDQVGAAA